MKRLAIFLIINSFILIYFTYDAFAIDDFKLWQEFLQLIKKGEFTEDMIRPHFESLRKSNMEFLNMMKDKASWDELESKPEIIRVNDQINYLIPLTFDSYKTTYCFTCIEENGQLYLKHIEAIFIRLDKISLLPTSEFPDLSDQQKAWAREEIYWSEQVRLFNFLSEEKGKEFAYEWVKREIGNGVGYLLGAKTWVPFVEPKKAFILYLCWEQAKLRGNKVILEKLDDKEAIVKIRPIYIDIFLSSSHLKQQISWEEYVQIFFTIWQERAEKAGWQLDFITGEYLIGFHFRSDR